MAKRSAKKASGMPAQPRPRSWREMVDRCREMEAAFGDGVKRVEEKTRAKTSINELLRD